MPDITLPHTFTSADEADANQLCENVYSPNATPDSLDVVCHMDEDNLEAGTELNAEKVQFGALHRVERASRNVTLIVTTEQFSSDTSDRQGCFIAGGCRHLDVPAEHTLVQVRWHVWFDQNTIGGGTIGNETSVRFYKKAPSDDYLTYVAGKSSAPNIDAATSNYLWHDFWWATAEEGRWQFALALFDNNGSLETGTYLTVPKVKMDAISLR